MEWVELGELVSIRKGTRLIEIDDRTDIEAVRMIMIEDLRNDENIKYTIKSEKNVMVNKDDIIIAWDGANAGLIGFNLEGSLGSTLARLSLKDKRVYPVYLGLYLWSKFDEIRFNCTGATIPHVNRNHLINIEIPVPPMNIQKQIVEVLDQAQSLIDKRKEQIKLLDDLIESIFYDMFGDPIVNSKNYNQLKLGNICNLKAGKFIKASRITDLNDSNIYPCYGGNGLRGYVKEYSHYGTYPLIGRQGALCGNINLAEGKFYATEHAIVVTPILDLNISWLYTMLEKMDLNRLASGAAQPGLNVGDLKLIDVIYPDIDKQIIYGNKFKKIESQKQLLEESLKLLEDNYNSFMQRAFKGELFN